MPPPQATSVPFTLIGVVLYSANKKVKIEEFYATRNLLKVAVRGEDVAEAALFFASDLSSRTTGACLTIDGGVKEAFPR